VQTTTHQGVGMVKALNRDVPSIEIDHEEIKGLMPGMQMEFHVKERSLLDGLAVGDRIESTVEQEIGGLKVTAIRRI
jgi:Cu/Ag efflux protein CusF